MKSLSHGTPQLSSRVLMTTRPAVHEIMVCNEGCISPAHSSRDLGSFTCSDDHSDLLAPCLVLEL